MYTPAKPRSYHRVPHHTSIPSDAFTRISAPERLLSDKYVADLDHELLKINQIMNQHNFDETSPSGVHRLHKELVHSISRSRL